MPQGALPFQYARERSSTGMTAMAGLGIYLDMMDPNLPPSVLVEGVEWRSGPCSTCDCG